MDPKLMPKILWGNLLFAQVVMVGVLYYLHITGALPKGEDANIGDLSYVLWALGLTAAAIGFRWDQFSGRFFPVSDDSDLSQDERRAREFVPYIVGLAICEMASVMGFLLGFLSGSFEAGVPLFIIGLFVSFLKAPKS